MRDIAQRRRHIAFDKHGLIGHPYPGGVIEGGDSASWTGLYVYCTGDTQTQFTSLEIAPGAYVRHPVPDPVANRFGWYYGHTWDGVMSRDQMTGVIAGNIRLGRRSALLRMMWHHAKRLFLFSYNTRKNGVEPTTAPWKLPDFTGPDVWALYLRGFGALSWLAFPVLCVLDLHLLLNAINVRYVKKEKEHVLNFLAKFFISREFIPTPVSWLVKKLVSKPQMLSALETYWSGWRGNPGMADAFANKLRQALR